MLPILAIIDIVIATLPKIKAGVEQGKAFYDTLRTIWPDDLPEKTTAEIAALMGEQFQANLDAARSELDRLDGTPTEGN